MFDDACEVFLLDTSSFFHRAYHASKDRPTYTKDGTPNAAVFLFRDMLHRLRRKYNPAYLIACCDCERSTTWRAKLYPEYKAQRAELAEDLVKQFPGMFQVLVQERIPIVQLAGYEADDLIGTLACRIMHGVVIVSGDKDMAQLVRPGVSILNSATEKMLLNENDVVEKFGVRPEQIPDYMALCGDSADNVPGARGIGPVNALQLIKQFGTVDAVIERYQEIVHGRFRNAVHANVDMIRLSKKLVTIDCEAPLPNLEHMYYPF